MSDAEKSARKGQRKSAGDPKATTPQWAGGLKRLYDSVVDEPLPDAFKDLLARLDDGKS